MKINNLDWTNQGNLTLKLAQMENTMTQRHFFETILQWQELDPENTFTASITVNGDKMVFISTGHDKKQTETRTVYAPKKVRERCIEILSDALIGTAVTSYPVYLDDDCALSFTDGVNAVAVVDDATNNTYIFEAGYSYVRLKTVWGNLKSRVFIAKPGTRIVKLCKDGFVEMSADRIEEAKMAMPKG